MSATVEAIYEHDPLVLPKPLPLRDTPLVKLVRLLHTHSDF